MHTSSKQRPDEPDAPRMKRPLLLLGAAACALAAAGLSAAACSGESAMSSTGGPNVSSSGSSTWTGGIRFTSFTPKGCGFTVATRPEYQDFALGTPTVGPSPEIRRVRLGLGGNIGPSDKAHADPSTTIAFAWQTGNDTLASEVTWGYGTDPSKWPAENRTQGITWQTPPGLGAADAARMHEAYLCGLKPATTYSYRVGGGPAGKETWSEVYSFTTTPNDPNTPITIGVSGDSRGEINDAWRLVQRRMRLAGVGLQLFSGDMALIPTDQLEWEKWLDVAWKDTDGKPLTLPQILILAAHGNHEAHSSLFFGNLVMPQDQSAAYAKYSELFYSVDVGPAHIIVLDDAWVAIPDGDPSYAGTLKAWLDQDLTAAVKNRANVPWIITVQHRPEFSSSAHGQDSDVLRARDFFVPIWDKYHVDLALRGHDHNYERSKPLTGPAKSPTVHDSPEGGTIYVVCAGSGAPAYAPGTSKFTARSHGFDKLGGIGVYGILTATKTSLKLEAHDLTADGSDPIFDTLTITH